MTDIKPRFRCRLGWHDWTPWKAGAMFIDTSWGMENPSRQYWSHCTACHKPRRMAMFQVAEAGDA